jgi:hypothetical protein
MNSRPLTWRLHLASTSIRIVIAATLWAGCSDDDKPVGPAAEDPRTTIDGVMRELIEAYRTRDFDRYAALFDQNDFRFVFDTTAVAENPGLPVDWGWPGERQATIGLFTSPLVERIELGFLSDDPVPATAHDIDDRPFPSTTMKVTLRAVSRFVETKDPNGGEIIIYQVDGDQADFFIYSDSTDLVDGLPLWKIFEWHDRRVGGRPRSDLPPIEVTWGSIKSVFS